MATTPRRTARYWHRVLAGLLLLAGPSGPLWAQPSGDRISLHYIERLNRADIDAQDQHVSDPHRVGLLGFSYGGVMSLIMTSDEIVQEYTGGKARFAAHLGVEQGTGSFWEIS